MSVMEDVTSSNLRDVLQSKESKIIYMYRKSHPDYEEW